MILLLDISGFSELTDQYAARSAEGAEQLSSLLDHYFGQVTRHIAAHGGDTVGYAGDGVLALWSASSEESLAQPALLAAQAAMQIQEALRETNSAGVRLVQRIGIGAGGLSLLQLGGLEGKWTFLVAGDPIREAGQANQRAGPGEVVLSPEAWRLIEFGASGTQLPSGEVRLGRITALPHALSLQSSATVAIPVEIISPCVPRIVSQRLTADQAAWLGEFRTLTVLYVQLLGIEARSVGWLERLNRAVEVAQKQLARLEGSLYQFLMDDEGLVLLAVFGFPPLAHEDDAARGIRASLALRAELAAVGLSTSVGIATGRAFCGVYGAEFRRQYSAVGSVMNIAARLVREASGGILVDEATQRAAAGNGIAFDPPRRLRLKGMEQLFAAYSPSSGHPTIVGRLEEQTVLHGALDRLAREHRSGVIVLEGEPGIGKSELVDLLQQLSRAARISCFRGTGEAIACSTPYHLWRGVFRSLFRLDTLPDDPAVHRRHVLEELAGSEKFELAPLLNAVLPLQIPENELTAQMSGQVRAENTSRLLAGLLEEFGRTAPLILTLEDAHWADSASWVVAGLVSQTVQPMLMVVTARPGLPNALPEYHQFLRFANTIHLRLRLLSYDETEELLRKRLNVEYVPQAVTEFIQHKTGGQPLFTVQLIYALRDAGLIRISGAACLLNLEAGQDLEYALERLQIPRTVEGVVTARLDRLDPAQQMALKVASVIGFNFSLETLRGIYPLPGERERLPAILGDLELLDLIHRTASNTDDYEFKHAIARDVVYAGVAFGKRRELHQAIAEWSERRHAENRDLWAPLLAHHWEKASQPARAMVYAAKAGEMALHNFANEEAARFLRGALELDYQAGSGSVQSEASRTAQRARWEILLGRACVNLSRHSVGREHLARGLASYGERMPSSSAGLGFGLVGEFFRQLMHRVLIHVSVPVARAPALRECAGAYESLVEILYLQNQSLGSLFCALKSLNLAERAGPAPERARGYATLGALSGFIPLRSAAEAYFRLALETAEHMQDLPALEWVLLSVGVYDIGIGNWERAFAGIRRALGIAERLGDSRRADDLKQSLACVLFHTGDIEGSQPLLEDAQKTAARRGDNRLEGEVLRWKAYGLLLLGHYEELRGCLTELHRLRTLPSLTGEVFHLADVFALRAAWHLRRGRGADALEAAREAAKRMEHMQNTFHDLLLERAMVAEVFLQLWERKASPGSAGFAADMGSLRDAASRACQALDRFSRVFPIGRPYAQIAAGQFESLLGRPRRAEARWREALAESQRFRVLRAEGLACYELGRHASEASAERRAWLERARTIFAQINTPYEQAATEEVLAKG